MEEEEIHQEEQIFVENPSNLLQKVTKMFLPNGFPTVDEINSMTPKEKGKLFICQEIIIQQFNKEVLIEYQKIKDEIVTQQYIVNNSTNEVNNQSNKTKKDESLNLFAILLQIIRDLINLAKDHKKLIFTSFIVLLVLFLYGFLFSLTYFID